jgi:hypothetical protein
VYERDDGIILPEKMRLSELEIHGKDNCEMCGRDI